MTSYNRIAGKSVERIAALSDGVFAIAMTLLVLDLKTPAGAVIHSEGQLLAILRDMAPQVIAYLLSFLTLGIFWAGQQAQLSHLEHSDRNLTWIHIAFLCFVSMMPFSTRFLSEFIEFRTAVGFYWLNILLLGLLLLAAWRYARSRSMVNPELADGLSHAIERRIAIAQALYAGGAALCFIHPFAAIAAIVLMQLVFVLGISNF